MNIIFKKTCSVRETDIVPFHDRGGNVTYIYWYNLGTDAKGDGVREQEV